MKTIVAPCEEADVVIPPTASASPQGAPDWFDWVERIHATPGRMQWPCPLEGCAAVLPSAAFAAEHLIDWHGWTELEIAAWWAR